MIQPNRRPLRTFPGLQYIAPFAVYIVFLAVRTSLPLDTKSEYVVRVFTVAVVLVLTSRAAITWRPVRPVGSIAVGALVFGVWILPDLIWPEYRSHWLFENSFTGAAGSSVGPALRSDVSFLVVRCLGSVLLVPIIEELFWRGWLMRYLIHSDFQKVAVGTYTTLSFWATAALFASEHGPFWDVGLLAGTVYNWWILTTRNISDCILAHATTNMLLAIYVVAFDQWQYWL